MIITMPLLFSYGTLRDPAVQRANFGRELAGHDDADQVPGAVFEVTDDELIAAA
jgi:hypothetical protein